MIRDSVLPGLHPGLIEFDPSGIVLVRLRSRSSPGRTPAPIEHQPRSNANPGRTPTPIEHQPRSNTNPGRTPIRLNFLHGSPEGINLSSRGRSPRFDASTLHLYPTTPDGVERQTPLSTSLPQCLHRFGLGLGQRREFLFSHENFLRNVADAIVIEAQHVHRAHGHADAALNT